MRPPNRPDVRPDLTNDHVEIRWVRTWLEKWAKVYERRKDSQFELPTYVSMIERAASEISSHNAGNRQYVGMAFLCAIVGEPVAGVMNGKSRSCVRRWRQKGECLLQLHLSRMIDSGKRKRKKNTKPTLDH